MPSCYYHPNLPSVALCSRCGRSLCYSCHKPYLDLALCPDCYHKSVPKQMPLPPAGMPVMGGFHGIRAPGGGMIFGPFPARPPFLVRFWWVPPALLLIAATLIFFNAAALLSPVFFAAWVTMFPWVAAFGAFGFILGVILGLVILGGLVLIFLGFRVMAAFIVLPAAIVSLFIGGGFFAGLIIGVLAALLVLMSEKFWQT